MYCPHCGAEHKHNSPCKPSSEKRQQPDLDKDDPHPLAGLDNPFWKPEEPAAASR